MGARVQAGSKPGTIVGTGPADDALEIGTHAELAGDPVAIIHGELATPDHEELTL